MCALDFVQTASRLDTDRISRNTPTVYRLLCTSASNLCKMFHEEGESAASNVDARQRRPSLDKEYANDRPRENTTGNAVASTPSPLTFNRLAKRKRDAADDTAPAHCDHLEGESVPLYKPRASEPMGEGGIVLQREESKVNTDHPMGDDKRTDRMKMCEDSFQAPQLEDGPKPNNEKKRLNHLSVQRVRHVTQEGNNVGSSRSCMGLRRATSTHR